MKLSEVIAKYQNQLFQQKKELENLNKEAEKYQQEKGTAMPFFNDKLKPINDSIDETNYLIHWFKLINNDPGFDYAEGFIEDYAKGCLENFRKRKQEG